MIYVGDHGAPFTRGKTTCYEAGVHVPFIMKYGNVIEAGTRSDALVSTVDIAPTIMDAVRLEQPFYTEGYSLLKTLQGKPGHTRKYLHTEFTFYSKTTYAPTRAVRGDRYKLIHNLMPEKGFNKQSCET